MKPVDESIRHRLIDAAINTAFGLPGPRLTNIRLVESLDPKPSGLRLAVIENGVALPLSSYSEGFDKLMQQPTICRIVVYKLSDLDKQNGIQNNGADECPAVIVRVWGDSPNSAVNLRLLTDGPETPWRTSVTMGDGPGQWSWPKIPQIGPAPTHR